MEEVIEKQKRRYVIIKSIASITLVIVTILMGFFVGYRISINGGGMRGLFATVLGHDEKTVLNLEKFVFLIVGESEGMTDTIILCSYNPRTQEAAMLSIPRDTFIGYNEYIATASDKINSLYSAKGIDALVKEVENLTNIEIPYYIKVNTKGLRDLVDTIGGVYYDVPMNMDYDDSKQSLHIHLREGYQLLDGDKAEQLVRFRHNNNGTTYDSEYGDNDYGRMRTRKRIFNSSIKQNNKNRKCIENNRAYRNRKQIC